VAVTCTVWIGAGWTALAGSAWAGEYHVYSCHTPSGQSAPADGWSGSIVGIYEFDSNECAAGGGLVAALGAGVPRVEGVERAMWTFTAPAAETIAAARLWRAGNAIGGRFENTTYMYWLAAPADSYDSADVFDQCVASFGCASGKGDPHDPMSPANLVILPAGNLGGTGIYATATCGGAPNLACLAAPGDENGWSASVQLFAADVVLEQTGQPSVSGVGGELAQAATVSGTSDLTFTASDPGGGVYEVVFEVDGRVVLSEVPDANGGHCRNVGGTTDGLSAFLYIHPCPRTLSVDVPFDTTGLSDGTHRLAVSVIDAAGNSTPALDRKIVVANGGPVGGAPGGGGAGGGSPGGGGSGGGAAGTGVGGSAGGGPGQSQAARQPTVHEGAGRGPGNGANPSDEATLTARWRVAASARLTCGYGRAQEIVGRLTGPGGQGISGAVLDYTATPGYLGAQEVSLPGPRTGPDGRWSVRVPGGVPSETLRFRYRSHLDDALPAATRTLTLRVGAGVVLHVSPRVASVGRTIVFRGHLQGGPIPVGGKQLVLEARSPGSGWIEFDVIRTDAAGGFRALYRFRFPGPVSYQFRVLSKYEADFPFVAGSSNVVGVWEQ